MWADLNGCFSLSNSCPLKLASTEDGQCIGQKANWLVQLYLIWMQYKMLLDFSLSQHQYYPKDKSNPEYISLRPQASPNRCFSQFKQESLPKLCFSSNNKVLSRFVCQTRLHGEAKFVDLSTFFQISTIFWALLPLISAQDRYILPFYPGNYGIIGLSEKPRLTRHTNLEKKASHSWGSKLTL